MKLKDIIAHQFREQFYIEPRLFAAPGRINLIGEHVDYNNGWVMPAAIDRCIWFAVAPSSAATFTLHSLDQKETVSFDISELQPGRHWSNYLMGVINAIVQRGKSVSGVNVIFGGNIPVGGGMSSSAAMCCGFAFVLNELFQLGFSRLQLALIAQQSEHTFAGARVGLMDQYASLFGKKDHVLLLDCQSQTHELIPATSDDWDVLLIDTKVKHSLGSSAYNDRRASCEEAVSVLQKHFPEVGSLRDARATQLYQVQDELGDDTLVKALFIVEEIHRTIKAAAHLKQQNWKEFGQLMFATHWGLSQAYEVSCPELDFLVSLAEDQSDSVYGARLMGGGFGGCTINLVKKYFRPALEEMVRDKYFTTFGIEPDFYTVTFQEGVHEVR